VGGVSIISGRMCEVAIPLKKFSNTIKKYCNIRNNPRFEEELWTSKVKISKCSNHSRIGKNTRERRSRIVDVAERK
jgi:hypothetical protein